MSNYDDDDNVNMWEEIVGEQVRGGQSLEQLMGGGGPSAAEILGAAFKNNPAFAAAVAQRVARSRPVVKNVAPVKARDWVMPFTIYGAVGTTGTVTATPQCLFRAEKLVINEIGSSTNGFGTSITQMLVGQKNQLPTTTGGVSSSAFLQSSLGNGIKFDTCQPALTITFQISFLQTCTWQGSLFGKAVL